MEETIKLIAIIAVIMSIISISISLLYNPTTDTDLSGLENDINNLRLDKVTTQTSINNIKNDVSKLKSDVLNIDNEDYTDDIDDIQDELNDLNDIRYCAKRSDNSSDFIECLDKRL